MQGGAIELARRFVEAADQPDLLIVSDMLDLPFFLAYIGRRNFPVAVYFHENQITYPWSDTDRDRQAGRFRSYGMINIKSALAADVCLFNSRFHLDSFVRAIPLFLAHFPDNRPDWIVDAIEEKSRVLPLGLRLAAIDRSSRVQNERPVILWNHRWEYDRCPA